jgi:hypothetical protein
MQTNGKDTSATSKGVTGLSTGVSGADRVCPQCRLPLSPPPEGAGGREACWCPYCERMKVPHVWTKRERAEQFRDTLVGLLKLAAVPEQIREEIQAGCDREIWSNLLDSEGKRFTNFDDFCRDPNGLGCDPKPVRARLKEWLGAPAFALTTTPVAQRGRRTDLEQGTSGHGGDKSRPSRTHTRERAILQAPPLLVKAHKRKIVGKVHAEFLVHRAQKCPECPRLKSINEAIEAGIDIQGDHEIAHLNRSLSKRINALYQDTKGKKGRARKAVAETRPLPLFTEGSNIGVSAAASDAVTATFVAESARAESSGHTPAVAGVTGTPTRDDVGDEAPVARSVEPTLVGGRSDLQTDPPDLKAAVVDLIRSWRRVAPLMRSHRQRQLCLELLRGVAAQELPADDETLYEAFVYQLRTPCSGPKPPVKVGRRGTGRGAMRGAA